MISQQVPFTAPDANGLPVQLGGRSTMLWCVRASGIASVDDASLRLQFEIRDRCKPYNEVRDLRIPIEEIDSIGVRRRWFKPFELTLRVRDIAALETAPGAHAGVLRIEIAREHRLLIDELIASVQLSAAESLPTAHPDRQLPPA